MRELNPRLPLFRQRRPSLRIDFVIADKRQDLINEAVDVALRFGLLHDSSMMARKLGTSARMMVASPAYVERAGSPRKPQALPSPILVLGTSGMAPDRGVYRSNDASCSVLFKSH